jgi:hypothetical protein
MQINRKIFPLADSVDRIQRQVDLIMQTGTVPLMTFT